MPRGAFEQEELIKAFMRLNVPQETVDELNTIDVRFLITDTEGKSTERMQRTGVRQGCPLSLFLLTILMTILFADVHEEVGKKVWTKFAKDEGSPNI